jgi:hypothetical protein
MLTAMPLKQGIVAPVEGNCEKDGDGAVGHERRSCKNEQNTDREEATLVGTLEV